jgi:hypothetical protein
MRIRRLKHLLTIITTLLLTLASLAPVGAQNDVAAVPFSKAPYRVGERLTYNVSFANFFTAAHVELWIAGHNTYFNRDGIQLRAHVETTGVVNAALYAVNNDYITYIAPETGQPFRTQQLRREAGSTQDISREYNEPVGVDAIPSKVRTGQFPGTYDFLSAVYRLRALPLTESSRYSFSLRDNDMLYEAELKVLGRELIKTNVGSFNTVVTQLRFPRNSSFNNYKVQIYFSDDERHVPVLFTAHHPSGDIRAELAGSELPGANPTSADTALPDVAASSTQVQPAPNTNPNATPSMNPARPNPNNPSTNATPQGGIPGIPGIPVNPNIANPTSPNAPQGIPANPIRANPVPANPNATAPLNTRPSASPNTTNASPNATPNRSLVVTPPNAAANSTPTALPAGLPFNAGEQLNFNIYLENVQQPVGSASFQVRARTKYFGRDGLLLTGKAQTVGTAQTIFSANDEINTYVDPTTLLPFRFEMNLQESKRRANQTVTIDQDRGNATTETGTRMEVPVGTYDLLSVFYALRSFNLKSPKPNAVSLLVNNRPRTLFITFLKRETIELGGQQLPALQLSLTTDDAQGDKNALRLWVSDDQRRLPLRITAATPSGRVRADLAILPIVRQ